MTAGRCYPKPISWQPTDDCSPATATHRKRRVHDSHNWKKTSLGPADRSLRARLTHLEHKFYREIPPPDLVIYLTAPLEVTIARNANRGKYEPEDFVRLRHAQSSNLQFSKTTVYKINTDQPFEETLMEVKKAIWNAL